MTKDEMKNRISLALKDPILQQGFECICKENTDLKIYNEKLLDGDIEKHNKIVELETQIDNLKSIGKTSYIKGIRTMANALKEYDRTYGAWTDYFEHKVDETLKMLLKKGVIKENLTTKAECETEELLDKQIEATYKVVEENNELKEKLNKATEILKVVLNKWKEERWILQSEKEVKMIENVMKEAEAFLEED